MPKILIIEDEDPLRENVVDVLSLEGFDVLSAPDGRVGVALARQHLPDVIVCDIAMPHMDGYQVLEALRSDDNTTSIPFIFLTARIDRPFVRHGMELGADDYITKPFTHQELLSALQSRLSRKEHLTKVNNAELERAKKELSQMVSHELRTPLVSINMVQEYISSQIDQLSRQELDDLLSIMRSGSQRLYHLVEQMVLLTQLESGVLNEDKVKLMGAATNIWTILAGAISQARQFAHRRPKGEIQQIEHHAAAQIHCYTQALTHAVAEIIANGLDFSPEDQAVVIEQWVQDGLVWVQVRDKGVGFPQDKVSEALRPFRQINRLVQEQQGMGLGLSLAKGVIELHGGAIYIESEVGKGTLVSVSLPALPE